MRTLLCLTALACGAAPLAAAWTAVALGGEAWTGAVPALVAVGVGAALAARTLTAPLEELTRIARALAEGDRAARAAVPGRRDAVGALAAALNDLAETLAQRERTRETLVRDTLHDLRSRLTALRSEVEALQDGVLEPGPATLATLHDQVMWLARLLDGFHTLARADGEGGGSAWVPVAPLDILDDVAGAFAPLFAAADLELKYPPVPAEPWVTLGDPSQLWQLFTNLFENSLRHTDPGGEVVIDYEFRGDTLMIRMEDSAPGVASSRLAGLFHRRGAGPGLAVCAGIVKAHGGRIAAARSALGGLGIEVSIPKRG